VRWPRAGWARVALVSAGVVVGLNLALALVDALLPSPSGPRSSSYATSPNGFAAMADLLGQAGHRIHRVRELPGKARLDPHGTVVLLDPDVIRVDEARALRSFVRQGGRLVAGGRDPDDWMPTLLGSDPEWAEHAHHAWQVAAPVPAVSGVEHVRSAAEGAWRDPGAGLVLLGERGGRSLLLSAGLGSGQMFLLADASPLQNRLLQRADNGALALGLAGQPARPVQFVEAVHGYGHARGLSALPARWKLALVGLGLAALLFLVAHARRLGAPDPPERELPPPRRDYVDALAEALQRTHDPAAAAVPVQAAARARLAARFGLAADAQPADVNAAALRAGLSEAEAAALVQAARSDGDLVAAGRALVRVGGRTGEY
jgi:Domain of unknown function (DUF4350)